MTISLPSHLPANKKQHYSNIEHFEHSLASNYLKSEIKAERIILNDYSQKTQLMLSCNDNQYCVCFDENEEGDGYIRVQCSCKPWLYEVSAIKITLDSSEQPLHAQLATQKPHIHSEGLSLV